MDGLHIIADLSHCRSGLGLMTDEKSLKKTCSKLVLSSGLTIVRDLFYSFPSVEKYKSAGITGTILLAESHFAVHTWPEIFSVTFDVYVCNFSINNNEKAKNLVDSLINVFEPSKINKQILKRGALGIEIESIK